MKGTLIISPHKASLKRNVEQRGRQDPYVKIELGDKKFWNSRYKDGAGMSPEWTDYGVLRVNQEKFLVIGVWDHDEFEEQDDVIGENELSLIGDDALTPNTPITSTYDLYYGRNKNAGTVEITFLYIPDSEDDNMIGDLTVYPLSASLKNAIEIENDVEKKIDPYVRITCGAQIWNTEAHNEGGENPKWNSHETFTLMKFMVLNVEVWDYDEKGKDDPIGQSYVKLDQLLDNPQGNFNLELKYDGEVTGSINLKYEYESEIEKKRKLDAIKEKARLYELQLVEIQNLKTEITTITTKHKTELTGLKFKNTADLKRLQKQLQETTKTLEGERISYQKNIDHLNGDIKELNLKIHNLEAQLRKHDGTIENLENQLKEANAQIVANKETHAKELEAERSHITQIEAQFKVDLEKINAQSQEQLAEFEKAKTELQAQFQEQLGHKDEEINSKNAKLVEIQEQLAKDEKSIGDAEKQQTALVEKYMQKLNHLEVVLHTTEEKLTCQREQTKKLNEQIAELKKEISEYKKTQFQLNGEIETLNKTNSRVTSQKESLEVTITKNETTITTLNTQITNLSQSNSDLTALLTQIQKTLEFQNEENKVLKAKLAESSQKQTQTIKLQEQTIQQLNDKNHERITIIQTECDDLRAKLRAVQQLLITTIKEATIEGCTETVTVTTIESSSTTTVQKQ